MIGNQDTGRPGGYPEVSLLQINKKSTVLYSCCDLEIRLSKKADMH